MKYFILFGLLILPFAIGHSECSNTNFCISEIDIVNLTGNSLDTISEKCFCIGGTDNGGTDNGGTDLGGTDNGGTDNNNTTVNDCLYNSSNFIDEHCENIPDNVYYSEQECANGELMPPIWRCTEIDNKNQTKSLYTWNPDFTRNVPWYNLLTNVNNAHDKYISFLNQWDFNKVMIYNGAIEWDSTIYEAGQLNFQSDCVNLFTRLNAEGIDINIVIYINDAINDLTGYENTVNVVKAVKNFNTAYPNARISGIHLDQEPNNVAVYSDLLATFDLMKAEVGDYPLTINSAIKPLWLTQLYTDGRPFFKSVIDKTDNSMLMAYSNNPATIRQWANTGLNYAIEVAKLLDIALETQIPSDNPPASDTLYYSITNGAHATQFLPLIAELNGEFTNDYSNYYGGLVIHHYSSYYHAINGVQPA